MHWVGRFPGALLVLPLFAAGCLEGGDGPGGGYVPPEHFADLHGLAVDAERPDRLYAATHHGLYVYEEGRWSGVGRKPFDIMGIAAHPSEGEILFGSGHPVPTSRVSWSLGFARSDDAGATWTTVSLGDQVDFHALAVSPAEPERVWGFYRGTLFRTDDGGTEWATLEPDLPEPLALAADPVSPDTLYAAAGDGVHASADAGATWVLLQGAEGGASMVATAPDQPGRLVAYGPETGLFDSLDAGGNWSSLGLKLPGQTVTGLALDASDPSILYVGTLAGAVHRTQDRGASWSLLSEGAA